MKTLKRLALFLLCLTLVFCFTPTPVSAITICSARTDDAINSVTVTPSGSNYVITVSIDMTKLWGPCGNTYVCLIGGVESNNGGDHYMYNPNGGFTYDHTTHYAYARASGNLLYLGQAWTYFPDMSTNRVLSFTVAQSTVSSYFPGGTCYLAVCTFGVGGGFQSCGCRTHGINWRDRQAASGPCDLHGWTGIENNRAAIGTYMHDYYGNGFYVADPCVCHVAAVSGNLSSKFVQTLSVNPNGSTYGGTTGVTKYNKSPGTALNIGAPAARTGYHYNGYVKSGGGSWNGATYTFGSSAGALTASWTPYTYYIAFNPAKPAKATNAVSATIGNKACKYDSAIGALPALYSITGWRTDNTWYLNGTTAINTSSRNLTTVSNGVVTVTPKWYENQYHINFNGNMPSYASGISGSMSQMANCWYENNYTLPACGFKCVGATFTGYTLGNKSYQPGTQVKKLQPHHGQSVTFKAQWRPNNYKVNYFMNIDGGTVNGVAQNKNYATLSSTYKYGTQYTCPTAESLGYERNGYYLAYWTANEDGTGARYYSGDPDWPAGQNGVTAKIKNLTTVDDGVVNLYAHWEPIPFTLVLDSNDCTTEHDTETIDCIFGTPIILPSIQGLTWNRVNLENVQSEFRGWNFDKWVDSGSTTTKEIMATATENNYEPVYLDKGTFVVNDLTDFTVERNGTLTLYTVWNDVPYIGSQNLELPYAGDNGNLVTDYHNTDATDETLVQLDMTYLEEYLLEKAVYKHFDREEGIIGLGPQLRIVAYLNEEFASIEHPTTYEIKYRITDKRGLYSTDTSILYAGYKCDILVDTE